MNLFISHIFTGIWYEIVKSFHERYSITALSHQDMRFPGVGCYDIDLWNIGERKEFLEDMRKNHHPFDVLCIIIPSESACALDASEWKSVWVQIDQSFVLPIALTHALIERKGAMKILYIFENVSHTHDPVSESCFKWIRGFIDAIEIDFPNIHTYMLEIPKFEPDDSQTTSSKYDSFLKKIDEIFEA